MVALGEGGEKGELGSLGSTCTYCFITNNDLLCGTWNSAQCSVAAWMGGEFGENGSMYMDG